MKLHFKSTYANRESGLWICPSHFSTSCFFGLNSLETPTFSIFRLLKTMVSHHFYHEISSFTLAWCSFHRCKPQGRGFALGKLGPVEVGVAQTIGVFVLWMVSTMANSCQFRAWQISICRILSFCSFFSLNLLTPRHEILTCFKSLIPATCWLWDEDSLNHWGAPGFAGRWLGPSPFEVWVVRNCFCWPVNAYGIWGEYDIEHKADSWSP